MRSTKKLARLIGFIYVALSALAIYALLYVPTTYVVHGDPAATARNILAAPSLYRSSILMDLLGQAGFILIGLLLYRLFKGVDRFFALLVLILVVVPVPIVFVAEAHRLAAFTALDPHGPLAAFDESQRIAQMSISLHGYDDCMLVAEIFWGAWLFPFGAVVYRSGFLPRFLGVFLIVAGFAYLAETATWLLMPQYGDVVSKFAGPGRLLELVTPLWMLILGAKEQSLAD